MESAEPLTKAKLFASHESGQWTEIGLGVVSIVTETLPANAAEGAPLSTGGKRGKASDEESDTRLAARLQMFSLDSSNDLLLSSYVSLDDIYTIQGDTILMWYDEAVSNDIACSFNSKDGCDLIYKEIKAFQQAERLRRVQDERLPTIADKFLVHPRNLATILDAAETQNKRFGLYVRGDASYFIKLAQLFHSSRKTNDTATMELVAKIVLALLQSPYSTEGRIIAQFVENEYIDDCIDIVQYGLGRRDRASGFVSFEERRATFHDPCHLPEAMKSRIHVLYSCGFLKDLIPLSLEPADAASYSLLSTFTLRFTMSMLTELCTSPTILPNAFQQAVEGVRLDSPSADPAAIEPSKVAHVFELAAFVSEIAKTVKNAMIGVDMRTEIFSSLVHVGLLPFLTVVMECALRYYDPPASYPVQQWVVQPSRAIQLVCDTLYSCATHFPECVEDLVAESNAAPNRCLLQMLLRAITVARTSAEAQSVVDAVQCCGVGVSLTLAMFGDNAQLEARRHEVLRYWIEGNVVDRPPLFHLASHLVSLLMEAAQFSGGCSSSGPSGGAGGPSQLSGVTERQTVYGLRLITAIVSKIDTTRCNSFLEVMTLSKLLPALAGTLERPMRLLANLQSSVTSFIAAVLERRDARLVSLVTAPSAPSASSPNSPNLLHSALRLFLQCSHRDNILSSSLAHLLSDVCDGVHREKLYGGSTLSSTGSLGPSPFVTLLRGEDSMSKTEQNAPPTAASAKPFESVAAAVLAQFGEQLAVASPVLYDQLQKALEETPEQAQQAEMETSSIASSMERSTMSSFADFDTAAIDFGLEPPLRTPALDAVTEERLNSLARSLTASDDDEDPLADLSSIEAESDDNEEGAEETATADATEASGGLTADTPAAADAGAEPVLPASSTHSPRVPTANGTPHISSPSLSPSLTAALISPSPSPVAGLESIDPPSGRGSLLEDEENRLPRRLSVKRGRSDTDKAENEEEAESKRMRAEGSAA
ncbi:hypothetical protein ABB37_09201 [Leptomonas pyrrhocoris]|uniref:Serine/threonine-protein phosphatase 4 regulatory subunit 3-like central domain-containing protein n=1 Tax=Leptomonas pyrrhocoris TaxID=157538 RepID=A0A0N0DRJ7_LEPPY|nr:hypothetical protein ABB37_09201 [Leptomonas pyrrhocoris]KPA74561.1 hypothetical protein ABB37_09201 [Leptomonas pyrrhocoris]|eukprot:XP_015653000.1 hypothetical protein ABB37_09201 [Leptomonas pyrrhocoris]